MRVDRLQRAGGPDQERLVVVAAEHVERVRRRDRDLRLLLGRSEDRLDGEAEVLRACLAMSGSRELDAEREHAQRARELAARRRLGRGRPGERAGARRPRRRRRPALEQLAAGQARRSPSAPSRVAAAEVFAGLQAPSRTRRGRTRILVLISLLLSPRRPLEGAVVTGMPRNVARQPGSARRQLGEVDDLRGRACHTARALRSQMTIGAADIGGSAGGCGMPIGVPRPAAWALPGGSPRRRRSAVGDPASDPHGEPSRAGDPPRRGARATARASVVASAAPSSARTARSCALTIGSACDRRPR